MYIAPNKTED